MADREDPLTVWVWLWVTMPVWVLAFVVLYGVGGIAEMLREGDSK